MNWCFVQHIASDAVVFPALQIALLIWAVWCLAIARYQRYRANRPSAARGATISATVTLTRGPESMNVFYGVYAVISGVFVALALGARPASDHRAFFVIYDVTLVAYVCLLNPWFRNKLIALSQTMKKL